MRIVFFGAGIEPVRTDQRSANPYVDLLLASVKDRSQISGAESTQLHRGGLLDIAHFHWPEFDLSRRRFPMALVRTFQILATARALRQRGAAIVWTVHNLRPHERLHPRLESWFYRHWLGLVDGALALSGTARDLAQERYPSLAQIPFEVTPHGHYRPTLSNTVDRAAVRDGLGYAVADHVIGFIGQIRPYKQVPELIELFRQIEDPDVRLLIAGNAGHEDLAEQVRRAAEGDRRIRLELRFLTEIELQEFTAASDLIALPYRDILNSGSAIYALSCDRPVLAPRVGSLSELQALVGSPAVTLFEPPLTPQTLRAAVPLEPLAAPFDLHALDWDVIAAQTERLYTAAIAHRARR